MSRVKINQGGALSIDISYGTAADCVAVQELFNHKEIVGWLGGFTMLDQVKACAVTPKSGKVGMWVARCDGKVVGALLCGGRPSAFRAKYGSVGVLPEYRRQRISTALYCCMTLQQTLEGRRLWEDSIVGDNPYQMQALPSFGLRRVGELRHRTGSGKGLVLFDFSLLEDGALDLMVSRVTGAAAQFKFQLLENYYTRECLQANESAYLKQCPQAGVLQAEARDMALALPWVNILHDSSHPTELRRSTKTKPIF